MPQLPSSFASAAAGQNRDSRGTGRSDLGRGSGSGEWPRSNGTRTFRRSSTTPFNQSATASTTDVSQTSAPTTSAATTTTSTTATTDLPAQTTQSQSQTTAADSNGPRYTREELLDIYRNHVESAPPQTDTTSLFMPNWNPNQVNGSATGASQPRAWGKAADSGPVPQDPTVCWDSNGTVKPISLEAMSPEEREIFATDVNSTLKPPQQKNQQNQQDGNPANGRKASVSLGSNANYQISSPSTASRPNTRRRETADTNPFPTSSTASPTASRFARDEPWIRRGTDLKESITDEPEEDASAQATTPARNQPFSALRSNTTGGTPAFGGGSASLWGTTGAFGSFALPTPVLGDKRFGAGGSRLAHLIPKDSSDNTVSAATTKSSDAPTWRPRPRTDTDPFSADDAPPTASALLGGSRSNSPPHTAAAPAQRNVFDTPVKGGSAGDFGMSALSLGGAGDANGPISPSETNPYRSPIADRGENPGDLDDKLGQPASSTDQPSGFGALPRSFGASAFDATDRSQTSSVGAKGFGGVHPLSGWPAGPVLSTPDRERAPFQSAFGNNIFSPLNELSSPSLGGLGGVFGAPGASRLGRSGSKLESLFPPAMQAQMHGHDQDGTHGLSGDSASDLRQPNPLGAIGRGPIGVQPRDTGSPGRSVRSGFDDVYQGSTAEQGQPGLTSTASQPQSFTTTSGTSFPSGQSTAEPTPVRTMVMPDRMRWVYLDPQGCVQGPFSGLEMHDWYKANFFTPDLRVKRVEDPNFEPLGQLIRRIGNSREPFLVPQMGIPHGPPPAPGPFSNEAVPPLQSAFPSFGRTLTAQQQNELERRKQEEQMFHARQRELAAHHAAFGRLPPFQPGIPGLHHQSSMHSLQSQPSFGNLTNPLGMGGPQLPLGPIGPAGGFFDSAMGQAPAPGPIGPSDIFSPDLNFNERQMLASMQGLGGMPGMFPATSASTASQAVGAPATTGEISSLRANLPSIDQLQKDEEGFSERLKEFHRLRAQFDAEEAAAEAAAAAAAAAAPTGTTPAAPGASVPRPIAPIAAPTEVKEEAPSPKEEPAPQPQPPTAKEAAPQPEPTTTATPASATTAPATATSSKKSAQPSEPTLTEKVRKTQAENAKSQQSQASDLPKPFPPPIQPTPQRPASNFAARLGERSATGTPDTTPDTPALAPPPTAPWAPQPGQEPPKGPSLKEIQEAEARKAAKKEEAAAAARRAALEQEAAAIRERERAAATVASGLPPHSTWGTGSPSNAAGGSPWKQPGGKAGGAAAAPKKTLAEIQREEELRKQKAKEAAAAAQANAAQASVMGKRYADLAGKGTASPSPSSAAAAAAAQANQGGAWATVGPGGKVKIPTGPAAQNRAASVVNAKPTPPPAASKPAAKPAQTSLKDAKAQAMEEFKKWLHRELSRGLIGVADIDQFAATLLEMPLDSTILAEAVYSYSTTMDGRHFAEEFVRRKKLADKGIVEKDPVSAISTPNNSGWNEVAKKGNSNHNNALKDEVPGFRVVSKKKGKK
ncbi:uncharacterized protein CTHT_0064880 [Thermochaetoides thermophila DSM 1495]|uniref:GYF domain-containing protein n=1 Tax=Chaetomium thermophilum (strain DSM 1495 / CBS 144.50 / IMI 039719) TaxID=759272 RepID=G0SG34_CHATD|nr:hypothetical protein CTHT_0064880 [Thermochaetoides thermophila DSM 1495]EGS17173.1 hypothetical protein CTHT_0064880 [Thermochaetoides thermophila DSM 1495]